MKIGVDYFPLDCHLDKNMEMIEAQFGLKGFAVIIKLFQMIYEEQGYYCEWNGETELLFSRKNCNLKIGDKVVSEVVNIAVKRGIFSEEKYKQYGILTSKEIQKTYFEITKRRLKVEVQKEYLLVPQEQIPQNVYINDKNVYEKKENVNRKEQRKEKKRKEKYPSEEGRGLQEKYFSLFWEKYPKKTAKKDAQKAWIQLRIEEKLYQQICQAVEKQKNQYDWQKEKGQYIPYPATWLRGERWKDIICEEEKTEFQQPKKDKKLEEWKKIVNGE